MTLTTQSLAMAVSVAQQAVSNNLMEACWRGPNTFAVPIRDKVTLLRIGYGAHTYDDELIDFFLNQVTPAGVTLARLQAFGFATVSAARTAAGLIRYKAMGDRASVANMVAALALQGWEIEPGLAR